MFLVFSVYFFQKLWNFKVQNVQYSWVKNNKKQEIAKLYFRCVLLFCDVNWRSNIVGNFGTQHAIWMGQKAY